MILRLLLACALLAAPATAWAQRNLAAETAAVEDLTSVREIKRVQAALGHLAIGGRWEDMAALFTADAVLQWNGGEVRGRAAIANQLRQMQGAGQDGMPAGRMNLRLFISPVVTLSDDGQSAAGRWREVAMTAVTGGSADWAGGTHEMEYRRESDGWRISAMRYFPQFAGPYADGWSHEAETLVRAPYGYTPGQAGAVLTGRAAAQPLTPDRIDAQATLLLGASKAENVVNTFGYYLDRGLYDDAVDLFAENARVQVQGQGNWYGQDGARRYLQRLGAPGLSEGELNDRPLLMPLINVSADGRAVLVTVVELGMTGQHGGEGYWSAAMVNFRLERGEGGLWRIAALQRVPLMRSTYADGWASPLPAALPVPAGGEPDAEQLREVGFDSVPTVVMPTGLSLIAPARGEVAADTVPNALAMAEAFDAAENLANAYGAYIDQFAWPQMAALFAEEGWRELPFIGVIAGRDRILEAATIRYEDNGEGPSAAFQAIHMLTQPYVTPLDDGRAQLRSRLIQFNSAAGASGSWLAGIYEWQMTKTDGTWRIAGMDLDYTWIASYPDGWTHADPAAGDALRPSSELLARYDIDAPIRGDPGFPYPRIETLPFHYANPVSGRAPPRLIEWTEVRHEP